MYSIDLLKNEHKMILMFFSVIKKMCCSVLDGQEVNDADMRAVVDFIKIYIEGYHHKKEEEHLYAEMSKLNATAGTMVHGIMSDHDRCHKYMLSLENA
ncbi:MAG: hemerythrin domain-containing protein, partial [Lachnospiraceae bacterium]|nr:hemerythrin domain-containing protein [Lachnospiraceae bacterium]